jgi:hypothetical protein
MISTRLLEERPNGNIDKLKIASIIELVAATRQFQPRRTRLPLRHFPTNRVPRIPKQMWYVLNTEAASEDKSELSNLYPPTLFSLVTISRFIRS